VLERAAAQRATRLRVAKVNTDEQPGLAGRFGIRTIPTLNPLARRAQARAPVRGVGRRNPVSLAGRLARLSARFRDECAAAVRAFPPATHCDATVPAREHWSVDGPPGSGDRTGARFLHKGLMFDPRAVA
jgi:hypothetical protein